MAYLDQLEKITGDLAESKSIPLRDPSKHKRGHKLGEAQESFVRNR